MDHWIQRMRSTGRVVGGVLEGQAVADDLSGATTASTLGCCCCCLVLLLASALQCWLAAAGGNDKTWMVQQEVRSRMGGWRNGWMGG